METMTDKDTGPLGSLFQQIIINLKNGPPVWEEFFGKTNRLCATLRSTIAALSSFLEAFQKVADLAANTRGSTREIGMHLTKLSLRHRGIEKKLSEFAEALTESLVTPMQGKMEDFKKLTTQLDKEHNKEMKKVRAEMKKMATNTVKLQKKVKKGKSGAQDRLSTAMDEMYGMSSCLETAEERALRAALLEEHRQFCTFIHSFAPALEKELSLLEDISQLQEIVSGLYQLTRDPNMLSATTEQAIVDMKGGGASVDMQSILSGHSGRGSSPPPSPRSLGSRKSSMCSISSTNSSSSGSVLGRRQTLHGTQMSHAGVSGGAGPIRVSSHDSGFISQDTLYLGNDVKGADGNGGRKQLPGDGVLNSGVSMWANWPGLPLHSRPGNGASSTSSSSSSAVAERPHTISAAFARNNLSMRSPLSEGTFVTPTQQNVDGILFDELDDATPEAKPRSSSSASELPRRASVQLLITTKSSEFANDMAVINRQHSQPILDSPAADADQLAELSSEYFDSLLADLTRYATLPLTKSARTPAKPSSGVSAPAADAREIPVPNKPPPDQGVFKCPPPVAPKRQSSVHSVHRSSEQGQGHEAIYQVPRLVNSNGNPAPPVSVRKSSISSVDSSGSSGGYAVPVVAAPAPVSAAANSASSAPSLPSDTFSTLPPPPEDFFRDPSPARTHHLVFDRRMSEQPAASAPWFYPVVSVAGPQRQGPPPPPPLPPAFVTMKSSAGDAPALPTTTTAAEVARRASVACGDTLPRQPLKSDLMAQIHQGVVLRKTSVPNNHVAR